MSSMLTSTPCYLVDSLPNVQGFHPVAYVANSPTQFVTYSPGVHPSPKLLLSSPLPGTSPLPQMLINLPNPHSSHSPVMRATLLTTTLQICPLLAPGGELTSSKLHYDVSKDPHTAQISQFGVKSAISPDQKELLVIDGTLQPTRIRIIFDHPLLFTTVTHDSSITVDGFIKLLHSHFRRPLGSTETQNLEQDPASYPAAVKNQGRRCGAAADRQAEWDQGMKRIDLLGKESKFRGVELDASTHDHLTLHVMLGR